ncbi:MAG: helix-turn-helix domain-containing protein [Magnetococcales bacterium]|nr:helix-turn-helix domain-containing protein [Magnetococcales bacterium]
METLAVIDFETTGLSPQEGARATEIAAVVLQDGSIVRRYQSLMNAGMRIPYFITELTGITNEMVRGAPPSTKVMQEVADFVGDLPLVAHNASFDRKFWEDELSRIRRASQKEFACTMLAARRLYPAAPNHKLGTLAAFAHLPDTGKAHRAMADAEMTAHLLCHMEATLVKRFQIPQLSHALLRALQRAKASDLDSCIRKFLKPSATSVSSPTAQSPGVSSQPVDGFPSLLREWREKGNLTQSAAAIRFGISQSYWSAIESGKSRPSAELVGQFQQLFACA